MELADDEELLYQNSSVKHRKISGTLFLTNKRIVWKAIDNDELQLGYCYPEVKMQKISPDTSSKVQLQVQLHNGNSFNFHFVSADDCKGERDQAKDVIQQLLIKSRKKPSKELEEKSRLLKENPELYQLYKDLVVGNVISAEEFWANRSNILTVSSNQNIGVSPEFLTGANVNIAGCNTLKYNLTADMIESIFRTYPKVKKKHMECVPDEVSEEEFWTLFFQSQYFHRNRTSLSHKAANELFGTCANEDLNEYLKENATEDHDPLLDLNASDDLDEAFGNRITDASAVSTSNSQLLQQFNHQSYMILRSNETKNSGEKNAAALKKRKREKLREAIDYDDLRGIDTVTGPTLALKNTQVYAQGPIVLDQDDTASHLEDFSSLSSRIKDQVSHWSPNLAQCIKSENACKAVNDLSPGGTLMAVSLHMNFSQSITKSVQEELKRQYFALGELLRHFWSCFPVQTKSLEEKVDRMGTAISKYKSVNIQQFKASLNDEHSHLADHLVEMIDMALNKYKSWQGRRQSNRSR